MYNESEIQNETRFQMIPSFEKRVRAFAIDTSAVMLLLMIAYPMPQTFDGILGEILLYVIGLGGFLGFYLLPYLFSNGQSFGKRIQKIKIVDISGKPAPLWRILLREIFKIGMSIFTFGIYLVVSFFVLSDQSRTIHDYLFRTKMIDLERRTERDHYFGTTESLRKKGL